MNYIIGEEFIFTCSASNADILSFRVNGKNAANDIIVNQGYSQSDIAMNGDTSMRNLTGTAQILHNGTSISCTAVTITPFGTVFSNVAVYQVQG